MVWTDWLDIDFFEINKSAMGEKKNRQVFEQYDQECGQWPVAWRFDLIFIDSY